MRVTVTISILNFLIFIFEGNHPSFLQLDEKDANEQEEIPPLKFKKKSSSKNKIDAHSSNNRNPKNKNHHKRNNSNHSSSHFVKSFSHLYPNSPNSSSYF